LEAAAAVDSSPDGGVRSTQGSAAMPSRLRSARVLAGTTLEPSATSTVAATPPEVRATPTTVPTCTPFMRTGVPTASLLASVKVIVNLYGRLRRSGLPRAHASSAPAAAAPPNKKDSRLGGSAGTKAPPDAVRAGRAPPPLPEDAAQRLIGSLIRPVRVCFWGGVEGLPREEECMSRRLLLYLSLLRHTMHTHPHARCVQRSHPT
jgi:hypothetical protein